MTTGSIERIRMPGLQVAKINMCAGDFIPLHDHPQSSVFLYVVSGHVEMCVFEAVGPVGEKAELRMVKRVQVKSGENTHLARGEACFHTVRAIEDTFIIDSFSLEDPAECASTFYRPDVEILDQGTFSATRIDCKDEVELPQYFKEEYAANCP